MIEKDNITRENLIEIERRINELEAETASLQYILIKSGKRARAIDMLEAYNRKFLAPDLTTINFPVMKRDASFHPDDLEDTPPASADPPAPRAPRFGGGVDESAKKRTANTLDDDQEQEDFEQYLASVDAPYAPWYSFR
jgi:hypothetical protein